MTHDEMIAVIQAHRDGKIIYCRAKFKSVNKWEVSTAPGFNFNAFDYKVKREPMVVWVNPRNPGAAFTESDLVNIGNDMKSRLRKFIEVMED